ncbi:hypothetical protein VaNZ11_007845, partial [Volvox africanus]
LITLLDPPKPFRPGTDYAAKSGSAIVRGRITYVLVNTAFTDPGATAIDNVDGDVRASLARSLPSEGQLNTRVPRGESNPYLITYIATDSAGNRAVAFRRVYVLCPDGERVCSPDETEDGLAACSTAGICGLQALGNVDITTTTSSLSTSSTSSVVSSKSTTSSSTSANTSSSSTTTATAASSKINTPPVLVLKGNPLIAIVEGQYSTYAPCTQQSGLGDLCDPGVTATDAEDGNLGPLVGVCGGPTGGGSLAACGIDTGAAGTYTINFTVVDSAGAAAFVTRVLRVCPSGEVVCEADLTCSSDGVCSGLSSLTGTYGSSSSGGASSVPEIPGFSSSLGQSASGSTGSGSAGTGSTGSGSTGSGSTGSGSGSSSQTTSSSNVVAADSPSLVLLESDAVRGTSVQLPRGVPYGLCGQGRWSSPGVLCDPGIAASDRLGNNITEQVYVCPPSRCVTNGVACSGHEFWKKGIEGCLDPNATVGTVQDILFVVFDRWAKVQRVTATRQITIISPCAEGENYCEDEGICSQISCEAR